MILTVTILIWSNHYNYLNFNVGLSDDSDEKHMQLVDCRSNSKRAIAEKAAIPVTVGMTAESA